MAECAVKWEKLCELCEKIWSKFRGAMHLPTETSCNPFFEFESVDVSKNPFRLVPFVLWLKKQPRAEYWYDVIYSIRGQVIEHSFYTLCHVLNNDE